MGAGRCLARPKVRKEPVTVDMPQAMVEAEANHHLVK